MPAKLVQQSAPGRLPDASGDEGAGFNRLLDSVAFQSHRGVQLASGEEPNRHESGSSNAWRMSIPDIEGQAGPGVDMQAPGFQLPSISQIPLEKTESFDPHSLASGLELDEVTVSRLPWAESSQPQPAKETQKTDAASANDLSVEAQPKRDVPSKKPSVKTRDEPNSSPPETSEGSYLGEIRRTLVPIASVTIRLAPKHGDYHPDIPEKDEKPRRLRAKELFDREGTVFHGASGVRTRSWTERVVDWEAAATCHRPLYFEEINLERYGYSFGLVQPLVSAAHFFGRLPALPYLMAIDSPHQCNYTLGRYRPGSCVPLRIHTVPADAAAIVVQGGAATGLVYLIP